MSTSHTTPTARHTWLPTLCAAPLGWLGALLTAAPWWLERALLDARNDGTDPLLGSALAGQAFVSFITTAQVLTTLLGLFLVFTAVVGLLWRTPFAHRQLRRGCLASFASCIIVTLSILVVTNVIGSAPNNVVDPIPRWDEFDLFWSRALPMCWVLLTAVVLVAIQINLTRAHALRCWGLLPSDHTANDQIGDERIENIRVWGSDPRYRKSWVNSSVLHFLAIFGPFLIPSGCTRPYVVPKGSGTPAVAQVQVQVVKKKKKKQYLVSPNSPILFDIPDPDDVLKEIEAQTQQTYQATVAGNPGAIGEGGGTEGGWPDGKDFGELRFIRLQHGGRGWDDGMGAEGADSNFLAEFKRRTNVKFPIAKQGESHSVALLATYPPGYAPPFVFMTGESNLPLSSNDRKVLKDYLLRGGMLFADVGSRSFYNSVKQQIRQVLPGKDYEIATISDDDPIFQAPYKFANGLILTWQHGGSKAEGIKIKGRWAVFIHPGDVNDIWKVGASGVSREARENAFQIGVNIVHYAVTNYLRQTRAERKR